MRKWLIKIRRSKFVIKILSLLFLFAQQLPVQKKTIIFESFLGKQFSDNPKALYDYIKENHPDYQLYWSYDNKYRQTFSQFENLALLKRFSLKWIYHMATAEYWITNSRMPLWIPKPKHTTYLQTWHGTPLKKLGVDIDEVHMPGTNTKAYKENFTKESSKWDFLISPNAYSTEIFKRAFQFNKDVIESGYPRNDILYKKNNEDDIHALKEKLKIPSDKKVILYAPTWRDNDFYETGKYKFSLKLDLDRLQLEFSENYVVVLRMHYLVAEQFDLSAYSGFAFDFSLYNDINELYLVSDMLITDYSSVFFDYANLERPIIFFVYDLEDYRDKLRGFYFDFEKQAPGPLLKTTEEIIEEIKRFDEQGFKPSDITREFYNKYCYLEDGRASERVVKVALGK